MKINFSNTCCALEPPLSISPKSAAATSDKESHTLSREIFNSMLWWGSECLPNCSPSSVGRGEKQLMDWDNGQGPQLLWCAKETWLGQTSFYCHLKLKLRNIQALKQHLSFSLPSSSLSCEAVGTGRNWPWGGPCLPHRDPCRPLFSTWKPVLT